MNDSLTSATSSVDSPTSPASPGEETVHRSSGHGEPGTAGERLPNTDPARPLGTESRPHRLRWLLLNIAVPLMLLAAGGAVIAALGTIEPEQLPPADTTRAGRLKQLEPVRVTSVQTLETTGKPLQLQVDGTVVPYREVQIATEVAGKIVFKAEQCEAGSYVEKGTVLMRIDPTDYELEVERFTRQQEQAYEAIREVDQEMINARRLIDVAKQDLALQQREVDRLEKLPKGYTSQGELDQAQRALLQSKQQQVSYENQLSALGKKRVSLQAAERLAKTQLRVAEVNLQRTEIRAPIEGVIVREDAELNSFVARGSTIVTMEDTSKVEVAANLRMDQLFWITHQRTDLEQPDRAGYRLPETPAVIEYALSGRNGAVYRWQGRLLGFDGIGLDPDTRTVPVRVLVDSPQRFVNERGDEQKAAGPTALVRGMYVRVLLKLKPAPDLVVIPARAMQPGNRVWLFEPDESVVAERDLVDAPPAVRTPQPRDDAEVKEPASGGEEFDPSDWIPGQVTVAGPVLPIDALVLGGERGKEQANDRGQLPGTPDGRSWICEDQSGLLRDGSLLVISPLGAVETEGQPVRAEVPGAKQTLVAESDAAAVAEVRPRQANSKQ